VWDDAEPSQDSCTASRQLRNCSDVAADERLTRGRSAGALLKSERRPSVFTRMNSLGKARGELMGKGCSEWTVDDLVQWLDSIGMPEHVQQQIRRRLPTLRPMSISGGKVQRFLKTDVRDLMDIFGFTGNLANKLAGEMEILAAGMRKEDASHPARKPVGVFAGTRANRIARDVLTPVST